MHIQNVVPFAKCMFFNVDPFGQLRPRRAVRTTRPSPYVDPFNIPWQTKSPRSEGTSRASPAPLGASLKPYPSLSCTSRSPPNSITTSSSQQQQLQRRPLPERFLHFLQRLCVAIVDGPVKRCCSGRHDRCFGYVPRWTRCWCPPLSLNWTPCHDDGFTES